MHFAYDSFGEDVLEQTLREFSGAYLALDLEGPEAQLFWPWLLYGMAFWPLAYFHLFFGKPPGPGQGPLGGDGD